MRLCFVTDALRVGGSEVFLGETLPRLASLGISTCAAIPEAGATLSVRKRLVEAGIPLVLYKNLDEVPRDFDAYIVSAWAPLNYRHYYAKLPKPQVALIHDQIEMYLPFGIRYVYRLGYKLLEAPNFRRTAAALTVSHWGASWLKNYYGLTQVRPVPNGIDLTRFSPLNPEERSAIRTKLGLKGLVAMTSARMSPEKNHLAILQAARSTPKVTYLLVGAGPLEQVLRSLARWLKLQNVRFLGRRNDIPELLGAADMLILPSYGENQSLSILEAMACGLPIIASHIPANSELITNAREGFLVSPTGSAVVEAVQKLADYSCRTEMGQAAYRRVRDEHNIEHTVAEFAEVLREILQELPK